MLRSEYPLRIHIISPTLLATRDVGRSQRSIKSEANRQRGSAAHEKCGIEATGSTQEQER